jgi:hypothetical protein
MIEKQKTNWLGKLKTWVNLSLKTDLVLQKIVQ